MTNPDLEDALDGLNDAVRYCDQQGHTKLAENIGWLYQTLGELEVEDTDPKPNVVCWRRLKPAVTRRYEYSDFFESHE